MLAASGQAKMEAAAMLTIKNGSAVVLLHFVNRTPLSTRGTTVASCLLFREDHRNKTGCGLLFYALLFGTQTEASGHARFGRKPFATC